MSIDPLTGKLPSLDQERQVADGQMSKLDLVRLASLINPFLAY